ncbi:FHA domain-containing protein [Microbacterium sp. A1-JK]|uniref:FHA domain-containing protein n=1 Tax=Microbacterium sp. A1-JK TaxID=3177516 RepID=UPI00388B560F
MSTPPVPPYPVIYINVAADGSGHLNVAGQHHDYPVGSPEYTRRGVTAFATELAGELRRPVRMQITDSQGRWLVAVHPNGTVTDLQAPAEKPRRARKQSVAVPPTPKPSPAAPLAPATPPAPPPPAYRVPTRVASPVAPAALPTREPVSMNVSPAAPEPLDDELEETRFSRRNVTSPPPREPFATLTFSTGDVAQIPPGGALIGRRPTADPGEDVELTVAVDDGPKSVSRTHLRVEWHDNGLWATDRASSNGTRVERAHDEPRDLVPWQPFQLHNGDVAELGEVRATVAIQEGNREVNL